MPPELVEIISLGNNPFQVFGLLLRNGALVLFFPVLLWMVYTGWLQWLQNKYNAKRKSVLLAVDVPKLNEQSMRAVEQIIAALHGVHFGPNKKEKYWLGVSVDSFSLEIVSIDGYIQFFIMCDHYNVDLVKGAIYAQYPDAEIVEVEDYVKNVPREFPDDDYEMWGTEFILAKPDAYPIKTYDFFEHPLTGVFADPMAAILELLSRLRPGEQVWLQLIITPEGVDWRDSAVKEVNSLIGVKTPWSKTWADRATEIPLQGMEMVHDAVFGTAGLGQTDTRSPSPQDTVGQFANLPTGSKLVVEEIQKKAARLPFRTKFRFVYIAPKEIMDTYRVAGSVIGAVKQFNTLDLNAFRAGSHTVVSKPTYFFVQRRRTNRKNRLMIGYRNRSNNYGEPAYVLSHVELATLFHFPAEQVRAPLLSKTDVKRAEPPPTLPVEASPFERLRRGHERISPVAAVTPTPPPVEEVAPQPELVNEVPVIPPPPSGLPVSPTPVGAMPPVQRDRGGAPLHSMPGLPPGVRPVGAETAPAPNPSYVPEYSLDQIAARQASAAALDAKLRRQPPTSPPPPPPAQAMAGAPQAAPGQPAAPNAPAGGKGAPPTNLPI